MQSNNTIQNELKELNSMLAGISNRNVYTVPDGYFDVLSHDILLAVQHQDTPEQNNSSVPAGYFDGLAGTIMGRIKTSEDERSTLLDSLKDNNVYRVPPGYFDELARIIMNKIEAEESENSTLLAGLKDNNVYRVPPGYFDNLATNIVSKLPQPAKVITMEMRPAIFRYAAAAVITGIIGLSVISVFNKKQTDDSLPSSNTTAAVVDIDKELSKVADKDIVSYLEKSGLDVNAALVASVTDDKNLPDQVDYMTDDKTLDNLLSELKATEPTNN